jgi:four helix bundle protein
MEKHRTTNIQQPTSNPSGSRGTRVFDLADRLLLFTSDIIDLTEKMPATRAGSHVAGQLLRSGTAPYGIHGEAESAESPDDFVHKLKLCLKELRETRRWLRLVHHKEWLPGNPQLDSAANESEELIRIFVTSIRTARNNRLKPKEATQHDGTRA